MCVLCLSCCSCSHVYIAGRATDESYLDVYAYSLSVMCSQNVDEDDVSLSTSLLCDF